MTVPLLLDDSTTPLGWWYSSSSVESYCVDIMVSLVQLLAPTVCVIPVPPVVVSCLQVIMTVLSNMTPLYPHHVLFWE